MEVIGPNHSSSPGLFGPYTTKSGYVDPSFDFRGPKEPRFLEFTLVLGLRTRVEPECKIPTLTRTSERIQKYPPLGFNNLHHTSIRVQNWGIYFLDPPGAGYVVFGALRCANPTSPSALVRVWLLGCR